MPDACLLFTANVTADRVFDSIASADAISSWWSQGIAGEPAPGSVLAVHEQIRRDGRYRRVRRTS